jgi:hypothetical protein
VRFVQNSVVSYTVKKNKEKAQNGAVLNGTVAFLLPLDVQKIGEEEGFIPLFSPTFLLSLSLLYQFFKARMLGYVRVADFYNVIANSLFCWSEAVESRGDERGWSYDWDRGSGLQDNRDGRVFSLPIPSNI